MRHYFGGWQNTWLMSDELMVYRRQYVTINTVNIGSKHISHPSKYCCPYFPVDAWQATRISVWHWWSSSSSHATWSWGLVTQSAVPAASSRRKSRQYMAGMWSHRTITTDSGCTSSGPILHKKKWFVFIKYNDPYDDKGLCKKSDLWPFYQ